ncbi:transcriptional repressor LexA [Spirulina subsalsa FACHB-351]|uniref:LexA repressor n=1 Tax=Spirulina subsalsa FACHB-351 TaxID=234711 RepID=A0ABT3L6J3_9CYAN|nr:transcriptional repressor LexA [Spirulina subsalsa]MCW6036610.1 transcriptional repressor LexA [Spirulina subsalsa FACHB-351]
MEPLTKPQRELYEWLVEYIHNAQHAPSIRQMMRAMNLRSPAPVQSRLERLRSKGYIDWTEGKARTIRILYPPQNQGLSILGAIAAGGLVEPFTDMEEQLDLAFLFRQSNCFALRVTGDSMIEDMIQEGDLVVMKKPLADELPKNGTIVAARVDGYGTTLKRFYLDGEKVTLQPANPKYPPITLNLSNIQIQGVLVGVWRDCNSGLQVKMQARTEAATL